MIKGIQAIGILFGLGMLYLTFIHKKKKQFTNKEYVVWVAVWIVMIVSAIFPNSLWILVEQLHFNRLLDFLVVVGILFVVGVCFYMYSLVRKLQKKTEELVQQLAIDRAENNKRHKKA